MSKISWFVLLGILTIVFFSFRPVLQSDFTNWDDNIYVTENLDAQSLNVTNIKKIFTTCVSDVYTPLTIFSFAIEYHFWEKNPFVYHLTNLLLHLGVTALIFEFILQLGFSLAIAALAALFFGLHPMHVESVAWITERKDVLYAFFYMLAVNSYWKYLKTQKRIYYAVAFVLGILSMLSKPMALSLPLILLLCDWWHKRRFTVDIFLEKIPYFLYIIPLTWITYSLHARIPVTKDLAQSLTIWIYTVSFYIQKFFVPVDFTPQYQLPQPMSWTTSSYALAGWTFLLSIFLLIKYRRQRLVIFAFGFYVLSIFFLWRFDEGRDLNIVADRFMYLPSVGFCILVGYGVVEMARAFSKKNIFMRNVFCLVVLAGYFYLINQTYALTKIWKDSVTLWSYVIDKNPNLATAYNNRGEIYTQKGMFDLAIADYNKALSIDPYHANTYNNRAGIFFIQGRKDLALADYNDSIKLNSTFQSFYNRGNVYLQEGQYESALADYNQALALNPQMPQAYNNRGLAFLNQGRFDQAIADFSQALKINSQFFNVYNNRGYTLFRKGEYTQALEDFNKTIKINPQNASSYYNRAHVYRVLRRYELSLADFLKAQSLGFPGLDQMITSLKEVIHRNSP